MRALVVRELLSLDISSPPVPASRFPLADHKKGRAFSDVFTPLSAILPDSPLCDASDDARVCVCALHPHGCLIFLPVCHLPWNQIGCIFGWAACAARTFRCRTDFASHPPTEKGTRWVLLAVQGPGPLPRPFRRPSAAISNSLPDGLRHSFRTYIRPQLQE